MLPTYKNFIAAIKRMLRRRKDLIYKSYGVVKYKAKDGTKTYRLFKIVSKKIEPDDKILLIRAGIHGDEIAGPLTLMKHIGEIFDYAHNRRVKLVIFPLDNPSGFEKNARYNIEGDHDNAGNNDFLRYELKSGELVDDLGTSNKFKRWYWSSDPKLKIRLPKETSLLHKELKKLPLKQIVGALDLHQDNFIKTAGAYQYAFGDLKPYQPIVKKIAKKIRIFKNANIDSGYLNKPSFRPEIISGGRTLPDLIRAKTNKDGFILRHDGTLPDLFLRLGAKYCVTVETTGVTPQKLADEVNLIWIYGIIELTVARP